MGLPLDYSVYTEFENATKHFNFIFSFGIDFIYEFFKFDNKYKNNYSNKLLKFISFFRCNPDVHLLHGNYRPFWDYL